MERYYNIFTLRKYIYLFKIYFRYKNNSLSLYDNIPFKKMYIYLFIVNIYLFIVNIYAG